MCEHVAESRRKVFKQEVRLQANGTFGHLELTTWPHVFIQGQSVSREADFTQICFLNVKKPNPVGATNNLSKYLLVARGTHILLLEQCGVFFMFPCHLKFKS